MKGIELINASAGSGKTYSLTQRVLNAISEGLPPESLLATTFTKKAAAELQERIRQALYKAGKYDAAQTVFDGFIGTVNGVCARLLTEYALDAGLSPALDVMPEEDSQRLFSKAIECVIEQNADAMEPIAHRLSRVGEGSGYAKTADWQSDVKSIVEMARANLIDAKDLSEHANTTWESFQRHIGKSSKSVTIEKLAQEIRESLNRLKLSAGSTNATAEAIETLEVADRTLDLGKDFSWAGWVKLSKLKPGKSDVELVERVRELAGKVLSSPDYQNDMKEYIRIIFDCAANALSLYAKFKKEQGLIDFVDQETKVLNLAQSNESFKKSVKERLQKIMVDEFQDTSPIQLALFLSLHKIIGQSVWVGDPKQAIYGFRGTDPQLMESVAKKIASASTLEHSWRSKKELVEFSNAVFKNVFHGMPEEHVMLGIPDKRKKEAKGGWIESWHLTVKNNPDERAAIANGVKDLLKKRPELMPADIAILCKTNGECAGIAAELESRGIRASASQGALLETRECQLALAGLKYLHDKRDKVALAEIVHLSPYHQSHDNWLQSVVENKEALLEWTKDPIVVALDMRRRLISEWTPLEALEEAIDAVKASKTAVAWGKATHRLSNLDGLRGACVLYLERCRAHRSAATITGFLTYIEQAKLPEAKGDGRDTVHVLTYHSAKGLEWPVVILSSLSKEPRAGAFGGRIIPAKKFNQDAPLKDRRIHFWPWPFGTQTKFEPLEHKISDSDELNEAERQAHHESHRLMYVGMTRARDGLIFAMRRTDKDELKVEWMNELCDASSKPVISWPIQIGEQKLTIGANKFTVHVQAYDGLMPNITKLQVKKEANYFSKTCDRVSYPVARTAPSSIKALGEVKYEVIKKASIGKRIALAEKSDMDRVGSAIHAFLGMDRELVSDQISHEQADAVLKRWSVSEVISPEDLVGINNQLKTFITAHYPNAIIRTEWPIMIQQDDNQLTQGWIDLLLELPDGYVVIDHKSYPGTDVNGLAEKYAGQLEVYRKAIEAMGSKPVKELLLHLPILGKVVRIERALN